MMFHINLKQNSVVASFIDGTNRIACSRRKSPTC